MGREDFREIPPRVEYSLTPFGVSLIESLKPLCEWGAKHMKRIEETKARSETQAVEAESLWRPVGDNS